MLQPPKPLPDVQTLKDAFSYDPKTGLFVRRHREGVKRFVNTAWAGKPAFAVSHNAGYLHGNFDGQWYLAHRIAWKMVYGTEPPEIDHINGDRRDNRIANLRPSSRSENGRNKAHKPNATGVYGVYLHKASGLYHARIVILGKVKSLGYFKNLEDAAKARETAKAKFGFDPQHGVRLPRHTSAEATP